MPKPALTRPVAVFAIPKPAAVPQAPRPPAPRAVSDEAIARLAYEIFEARGGDHGRDLDDWLEAERRLKGEQK